MKKLIIYILMIFALPIGLKAQTTYTVGTSSFDFQTLQQAFDYINLGAVSGDIILELIDNTTETGTAVLYSSGSGVNYTSVLIYPTVPGLSINGSVDGPLIDLNSADHLTFDGRVNQLGAADLSIINSSIDASASTIKFSESATTNVIQYCIIKSSESSTSSGAILFSTSTSGNGNDNNVIDHNYITSSGSNRPVNAICSIGSAGSDNSGNTISNNNIYDFLNKGVASNGIFLNAENSAWTISGNNFYETSSFVPTASVEYNIIKINNTGINYNITGNYIGGQTVNCGGAALAKTNAFNNTFFGIWLSVGTGTASSIQNNTIQNFDWNNSSSATWTGIHVYGGDVNIGTGIANFIGSPTGTGSVILTGGSSGSVVYGIYIAGTGTVDCRNNIIGSVTAANSSSSSATHFYGIIKGPVAGTTSIRNNSIGSTSTSGSISTTSTSSANAQNMYGIYSSGSGTINISGNNIGNMINAGTFSGTTGQTAGIITKDGTNTISDNNIYIISSAGRSTGTFDAASLAGISQTSAITGQTISGNTVLTLSNTTSSAGVVNVFGINYAGGTSGTNTIEKNFVNDLTQLSTNVLSSICGIGISAGANTVSNNIISLGSGIVLNHSITGILESGAAGNNNSIYFNTIYIGGSPASGNSNTFALYSNAITNTRNFRNNIFANTRSNSGSNGSHYALYIVSAGGSIICDYNDYYAPGTGGIIGFYGSDKSALPIVTAQDVNSKITDPLFGNPGGTTPHDYLPSASGLTGISGTGVTVDYNGATRTIPVMGALESGTCANPTTGGTIAAAQAGCSPFNPSILTSTLPASGHTGSVLEYKWQQSTTSSSTGFSDIVASNSTTYDPGLLTQTTWYKRLARVTCTGNWTGASESNVIVVTINPLPVANAITGANSVCSGGTLSLTSNASGTSVLSYIWTSSNTSVATVNNSGVVTPLTTGSTNITYKVTDGSSTACQATSPIFPVTVNALPVSNPITGGNAVCIGNNLSLIPNATGTPVLTYTWLSENTSVATINSSGIVTPISPGSATIRYTVFDGSSTACSAISAAYPITVRALPVAGAITGANSVCVGGSINLTSNATGTPTLTYIWNSSNPTVATVNNSGLVTTLTAGTTNITYTITDGTTTSCQATSPAFAVTVNSYPVAGAITGGNAVCVGGSLNLMSNATGTPALTYVWNSSNPAVATVSNSGVVTPVAPGATNITYTVTDGSTTTCAATSPILVVTINALPVAGAITGSNAACSGSTTQLTPHATGTGTLTYIWSSSNTAVATVNNSGLVTAVSPGISNITYTVTDGTSSACQTISPLFTISVNAVPVAGAITGGNSLCMGGTLSLSSSASGTPVLTYVWASSNIAVATVSNSGVVTPVSPGTTNITYTVTDGSGTTCSAISPVNVFTVNVRPANNLTTEGSGTICSGTGTNITVDLSESGVNYQLRNSAGNIIIGLPVAGTGGAIILPTGNLTTMTTFNVLATNSTTNCSSVLTETETVIIDPATSVGTLSAGTGPFVYGDATGTITLSGNTGSIIKWQKMAPAGAWVDIANTSSTYNETPFSSGTWQYRVQVQSGACPLAYTNPLSINVLPKSLAIAATNQAKSYGSTFNFLGTEFTATGLINSDAVTSVTLTSSATSSTVGLAGSPYIITPSSAVGTGLSNYTLTYVDGEFSVTKANLSVTADNQSKVYETANPVLTFIYTGWQNSENEAVLTTPPVAATIVDLTTLPGIYTGAITVSGGSDDNYNLVYIPGDFTVTKKTQTISFSSLPSFTYGAADFNGGATSNSGLTVSYASDNTAVATVAGGIIHITGAGTAIIIASQSGDNVYLAAPDVLQTLTVSKSSVTFTADNESRAYLTQNPVLTYTVTGFVNSETQSVLDLLPSIQTSAVMNSPVEIYPITLSGGSDNNYNYTFVSGTLTITKIDQLITFNSIPEKLLVTESSTLEATSTSGLTVLYESLDPEVATVISDQLTGVSKGNVRVRGYNAGDQNYNASETIVTVEISSTHKDIMYLFTPNSDGFNDYWELPELTTWGKCDVKVYNRWGKLVFADADYNNLWDGRSNGSPLPEGAYYFMIKTENAGAVKGTVNIVR